MHKYNTTPITSFIDEVIKHVPGWTPADQLLYLYNLIYTSSHIDGDILEIGSWCGRSTVVMAHALKECGKGRLQSIDLFPEKNDWKRNKDGTWSFSVGNVAAYSIQTVWDEPFQRDIAPIYKNYNSILDVFLSSLDRFHVSDIVDYHKGDCDSYKSLHMSKKFRLAFIDGDHSYTATVNDASFALENMPNGGWLCFDDAFSVYDGVSKAIEKTVWQNRRVSSALQLCRKFHIVNVMQQ